MDDIVYILCGLKPNELTNQINRSLNGNIVMYNMREISRLPTLPVGPPDRPEWDLSCLENRIRTFIGRWKLNFITPEQMAKAGFYYLGPGDRVRCMFCAKEVDRWQPGDNPVTEHKRVSPLCIFFKENPGSDVCGHNEPPPICHSTDINVRIIQDFMGTVCIEQKSKVLPANKAFTAYESRLRSFNNCKTIITQDIRTLCKAGLFYIGNGENDMMLCYCCNQGLKDWESQDNPWLEHARWSPNCSYVLLMLGKKCVARICSEGNNQVLELSDNIVEVDSDNEDMPFDIQRNDVESSDAQSNFSAVNDGRSDRSVEDDGQLALSATDNARALIEVASQQDLSTVANSMLCKICLKEKVEVLFIPCGHTLACIQCSVTLNQCAICRQSLTMVMRIFLYIDGEEDEIPRHLTKLPPKCLDEPVDPMLCKMCYKEEMAVTFFPCRHICTCLGCATKIKECPICVEPFFALAQVFL